MSNIPFDASEFLFNEARLLDSRDFKAWISLYTPDCLFWMPAWRENGTQTTDPDSELSLIYYRGRRNLEDRINRINSGQSVASQQLPRVSHMISNIQVVESSEEHIKVCSVFTVNVYDLRSDKSHCYFGNYEHSFSLVEGEWMISGKIINLLNEVVPTMLDVYSI